jgi:peptidyl-Lys metalloendopeptidase
VLVGLWACAVTLGASAAPGQLDVRLSVDSPVLRGDVDVPVTVTITNTGRQAQQILKSQLPLDDDDAALIQVTHEHAGRARYQGPLIKRAAPQADDLLTLEAGATLSYTVELSAAYDLSRNGRYAIQYLTRGVHGQRGQALRSDTLYLWLEGRSAKGTAAALPPAPAAGVTSYTSCSATQQTALQAAVGQAVTYANGAVSYLGGNPAATPRYTKWFGAFSNANWNTAKAHFGAIQSAFTTQSLSFDCKCKKTNTYAYVYPTQPYKIYLCGAFWSAPLAGTDSRGGTLIHEMSHFNAVAGTNDWAYGQAAAANLAITDPAKALDNADSHEYFAENTPLLP